MSDTLRQFDTLCHNDLMMDHAALELADALPGARFYESRRRLIERPIAQVWHAARTVTAGEVRVLSPLFALRGLPKLMLGRERPFWDLSTGSLVDGGFAANGFVILRADEAPTAGRALLLLGVAARFWSPAGNAPVAFDGPEDFLDFAEPGLAKAVIHIEATDCEGSTELVIGTSVTGNDQAADRSFAPYAALIRLPERLIYRSWLAAIERRARAAS